MLTAASSALAPQLSALCVPLLYIAIAIRPGQRRWPADLAAMNVAFLAALLTAVLFAAGTPATAIPAALPGTRLDPLTVSMLLLITFIGAIILRFSRHYLAGDPGGVDPGQVRFRRWFCATLACVATLVITDHLLVLLAAWVGTSLCLHQLLVYYPDRPKALLAAHKKFLISRLADLCLLIAVLILGWRTGSFQIDRVMEAPAGTAVTAAGVLLAIAAILKCAQLPFHGWLIQVMEAPTPVSALLHAGIVNIGGFLMIRLAPLMAVNESAQLILVVVGATTAVTAALIMETRISIKVMLAWSTCAQMGFMLLECGLGLYHLALLHLLAHSLYKAYRFLNAGQAVDSARLRAQAPAAIGPNPAFLLAAAAMIALLLIGLWLSPAPRELAMDTVLGIAILNLIGNPMASRAPWRLLSVGLQVTALYLAAAWLFSHLIAPQPQVIPPWVNAVIAALFLVSGTVAHLGRRGSFATLAHRLYPHLYGGFYLDEIFTRLTLLLWPPRHPRADQPQPGSANQPLEASS